MVDINEENFEEYFFDVRQNKPRQGDVIACYTAMADFIESNEKRQIIDLLEMKEKGLPASQVMRKLLYASELDSVRVPRLMSEDLISGMSKEEVLLKPYRYKIEIYYYTKSEHIPVDDPHWSCVTILNLEKAIEL